VPERHHAVLRVLPFVNAEESAVEIQVVHAEGPQLGVPDAGGVQDFQHGPGIGVPRADVARGRWCLATAQFFSRDARNAKTCAWCQHSICRPYLGGWNFNHIVLIVRSSGDGNAAAS